MNHHHDIELVDPQDACPKCGQRSADELVWIDDEQVQCASCGTVYTPLAGEEGGR